MHINFIFSKDAGEIRTIYAWSDNDNKNMWGSGTDDTIAELFESFLNNYQKGLQIIKASDFKFESVDLLDYYLHKVSLKRGRSYIKSLEWLVNKRATMNPKNEKDDKGLQYVLTLALYYNKIKKKELKNIFKKIKHVDFPSHQKDWKNFEQNESVALNVLFSSQNSEQITLVYESKHNFKRENNVVLLMINDGDNVEKYYFAVKNKTELFPFEWLRCKKEVIINGDNCFQNALNDALDYQKIKKDP